MPSKLTILVADDDATNRHFLERFVHNLGHKVVLVENGLAALEYCRGARPDVILMDIIMPVMDGLEATRQIRQLLAGDWVPIILLTARSKPEDILEGLNCGSDDYLLKPINFSLLATKIKVMLRIVEMQGRIARDADRLEMYYRKNEEEQALAKHVLNSLTSTSSLPVEMGVKQWIEPAVNFSGDVIVVAQAPTGIMHVMLADSTGHGLSAAISCLPVVSAFHAMTQKGFSIGAIVSEINQLLRRSLPLGHFVAAVVASVDYVERIVSIWNGGVPCAWMLDQQGRISKRFESQHPPLGILSAEDFDSTLVLHRWSDAANLLVCSDGLTEARNIQGREFGEVGLRRALSEAAPGNMLESVVNAVTEHTRHCVPHDDISLVVVPCEQKNVPVLGKADEESSAHTRLTNWEIKLSFGPEHLRADKCMPTVLGWLNQIGLNEAQFGEVLLVLSELMTNAIDHGVLKLSSAAKNVSAGFAEYMIERERRLAQLESGSVELGMFYHVDHDDAGLQLWVRDSGDGFDYHSVRSDNISDDGTQTHGRGIPLVRRLCQSVRYIGNGNHVEVEYALKG